MTPAVIVLGASRYRNTHYHSAYISPTHPAVTIFFAVVFYDGFPLAKSMVVPAIVTQRANRASHVKHMVHGLLITYIDARPVRRDIGGLMQFSRAMRFVKYNTNKYEHED